MLVYLEQDGDFLTFIIGVSSGIFGAASPEEKEQYVGLYKKAQYCITKGVQFVQIDLESVAEFKEPGLKENMEKIKRLGVNFGIHSETKAFGVEIAELDSAIETDYEFGQERLREILEKSGEIGSKYVLVHSSESEPFLLLERHLQPAVLVDFFGNRLRDFLQKNEWLIDWAIGSGVEDFEQCVFNAWKKKGKQITSQDIEDALKEKGIKPQNFLWIEIIGAPLTEVLRRRIEDRVESAEIEFTTNYENMNEEQKRKTNDVVERTITVLLKDVKTTLLDYTQSRTLHYGPERIAYYFIAKYMEKTNDSLWTNIVENTLKYFAKVENKNVEQWLNEKGIKNKTVEDENFRLHSYLWVPAVSAKYIWGHMNQDKNPGPKKYPDLKPILKKYKMPLVLETPMAHRGIEEWLRLPNPIQMYHLVKEIGSEYAKLALDFEHMLSIRLDVENVIDSLPEDAGKYVIVIHAGWPSPLSPAHIPIYLGSEQQLYLYKMYYKLMQKGFGKDGDYYLIFERGGGADPIKTSVIALQYIKEFLEKNVPPEELIKHPEFFGIGVGDLQRQIVAIREHARDPLKGLLVVPEEEYTSLGRAATEKGIPPEKWKKEELR